jgi:hypothetical protein
MISLTIKGIRRKLVAKENNVSERTRKPGRKRHPGQCQCSHNVKEKNMKAERDRILTAVPALIPKRLFLPVYFPYIFL